MIGAHDGTGLVIIAIFVVLYVAGACALALWVDWRYPRLGPTDLKVALVHLFAAGLANELLDGPLGGGAEGVFSDAAAAARAVLAKATITDVLERENRAAGAYVYYI
jgi:hypothetical protein